MSAHDLEVSLRNSTCRQARELRSLSSERDVAVAAFAVCIQINKSPLTSKLDADIALPLRNSPCRQARELRSLAVAAFAVCMQKNNGSCVSKLPPSQYSFACAWLIANAQKAGDTHPVRTPGLRDMSLLAKPKGLLKTVIPNKEDGDRSLAVFLLMAVDQQVGQPSFVL